MFTPLVSAIWDQVQCPTLWCRDFFVTLWNCRFMLMSIFNKNFSPFPVTTITCNRPGSVDTWVTIRIRWCWVSCVLNSVKVHLAVWLQGETLQTEISRKCTRIGLLMHIHWKTKTFLLRVTVTLTMIQMTLLTPTSRSRLTIHCWPTVPVVHRFTWGHSGLRQTQPHHINKDPFPVSILTARQGRQAPSTSQLKNSDKRHNRHWLMQ